MKKYQLLEKVIFMGQEVTIVGYNCENSGIYCVAWKRKELLDFSGWVPSKRNTVNYEYTESLHFNNDNEYRWYYVGDERLFSTFEQLIDELKNEL